MKQCTKCNKKKLLSEFYKHKIAKDGLAHWCKECNNANTAKCHATPIGRAKRLVNDLKNQKKGKRSLLEKTLTIEDIIPALQNGKCQLTGLPFDFKPAKTTYRNPYAPSLDRIDSQKGYTKNNVRIVLTSVNEALGEHPDETMLPILKAMVKAIENNAKQNTTTPVPARHHREGDDHSLDGFVLATGPWKDGNNPDNYRRTIQGQDADHSTQASSGDSMGRGSQKVATPKTLESFKDYWESRKTISWP